MKTFISIILVCLGTAFTHLWNPDSVTITEHSRGCTGSPGCTACTNCSGCVHCARNGGTCGACSRRPSESDSRRSRNSSGRHASGKSKSSRTHISPKIQIDAININTNNRYMAGLAVIKVYEKPSLTSKVITKVSKNEKLKPLPKNNQWYTVLLKKENKMGYIYYGDLK
ncbi:SH3 domain-containing protein [uncultured Chryseobacterium sp.]|uniref:SH3 domain-containing protein n=1 Tax=uncultured Chryseobacterium sp. TaxID=259322 RepID=UPI0025F47BF5|nr:SH3 domain-containing protein [uncultured Chryseobacterium sp.]